MLTKARKREFEAIEEIARKKDISCWINAEPEYGKKYTFNYTIYQEIPVVKTFHNWSLTLGLNRLMREIKAYPVVD